LPEKEGGRYIREVFEKLHSFFSRGACLPPNRKPRRSWKQGVAGRPPASRKGRRTLNAKVLDGLQRRLLALQRLRGYTSQAEFAEGAGVTESTLHGWLTVNPKTPDLATLTDLARKEGISLDWLLFGEAPELRGASRPLADLGSELHAVLARAIATGYLAGYSDEVALLLPPADQMLTAIARMMGEAVEHDLRARARWLHQASVAIAKYSLRKQGEDTHRPGAALDEELLDGPPEPGNPAFLKGMFKDGEIADPGEEEATRESLRDSVKHLVARHGKAEDLALQGAKLQMFIDLADQAKKKALIEQTVNR